MISGEDNPRATLSDDEVEMIRKLWEGDRHLPAAARFWTGPRLAEKYEISVRHVHNIVQYRQRVLGGE